MALTFPLFPHKFENQHLDTTSSYSNNSTKHKDTMTVTQTKQQFIKTFIESRIAKHQVVIFAKSWCPYCIRTKALLMNRDFFPNADVQIYDLDTMGETGDLLQMELYEMTGQATVPSVWVNGTFLGGNSETQTAMKNGHLSSLLQHYRGEEVLQQ
jgi:glutaredoxin 3